MKFGATKPLKILVVEDDHVDRMLLQRLLSQSSLPISEVKSAESLNTALELLDENHFDVVLLDLNLPDSSGMDTLVRMSEKYPHIANVVITGQYDEDLGLKAIASGAPEYLIKGSYNAEVLSKSIHYAIERKKAEFELQLAEERYRTIFENSAVAITMVDEQGRLISWNKFTEGLLGMDKEDLYLRPVSSLYPPKEWERIRTHDVRQKGMRHHLETRMIKKDGEVIDIDISISVLKNPEGKTTGSVGVFRDITERKRIHEILDRKQKNLEAIFDASPVGMLLVDKSLIVRRVNDVIRKMVRRGYSQIINQRSGGALGCINSAYSEKGCGYSPACAACSLRKIVKSVLDSEQSVHEVEIHPALKVDGKEITPWLCISAEPVTIDGRKHVVVAVNDITDRKKAEEKLEETMKIKSQFISTVSHELRTPLASIREGVAIVLDGVAGEINDEQRNFLNITERNVNRLARLINDVLDFQKFEAGKMRFNIQENDINEVVGEVHKTMASFTKKKGMDFSLELGDDLPKARFDRDKIIQVLTNLVNNAIKFTPQGGKVSVSAQRRGEELVIRVSDTGMGIPKEDLPKIFDRFYRVHRPGEQIQGTGLGLAIVKRIVMMHGGRIEVESQINQGTTFTVLLPLDAKSVPEVPPAETDELLESNLINN